MSDSIFETVKDKESPLAEQAAEQISQLIIDRQLTNGEKLPNEFELAEQLNVGRGTVREAVKLLVARNVLEIRRGRGTFVAHQTGVVHDPLGFAYMPDQLRLAHELLDIRLNVEPWVASLAAQQATDEDVAELRELCAEVETLIHAGENHLRRDEALHVRLAAAPRTVSYASCCRSLPIPYSSLENSTTRESTRKPLRHTARWWMPLPPMTRMPPGSACIAISPATWPPLPSRNSFR